MESDNNNIVKYYSSIDKDIINILCKNEILKNLIKLSTETDIYIFNKKYKNWQIKTKNKLLKECTNTKKKEIMTSSYLLSNLAKKFTIILYITLGLLIYVLHPIILKVWTQNIITDYSTATIFFIIFLKIK